MLRSHIAVAITFEVVDGKYVLKEYWTPRDGSYYVQDIRDKFPDEIEDEALDTQKYILAQKQECYDQAVRYGGVDTYSAVNIFCSSYVLLVRTLRTTYRRPYY